MFLRGFLCAATLGLISMVANGQACSQYNTTLGSFPHGTFDATQRTSAHHTWTNLMSGSCTYAGTNTPCSIYVTATSSSAAGDVGTTFPYFHTTAASDHSGASTGAAGATATADAEGAAAATSCFGVPCGSPT